MSIVYVVFDECSQMIAAFRTRKEAEEFGDWAGVGEKNFERLTLYDSLEEAENENV